MNINADSKVFLCKYKVKNFNVINGKDHLDMDASNILTIEYICDYEQSIFAILKVVLRIDVRKKMYILKHKLDIVIKLELERIGANVDLEDYVTGPESVFNLMFSVYFNDDDENLDVQSLSGREYINETVGNEFNDEDYFESQNMMEMYLFNAKLLQASRYSFNRVYTSTLMQNAIGHMLGVSGHSNVLMSRIENYNVYNELLLPPNPVFRNILYLDQYYGLYEKGSIVFYDLDVLYIINANGKVTAKRSGEWTETNIMVPSIETTIPGNAMLRQPKEKISYAILAELDINHQRLSTTKDVSAGSRTRIVTTNDTSVNKIEAKQERRFDYRNDTVAFIKKDNIFADTVYQARMEENDAIVYINGNNLDISAFTPNKTYKIIYDEQSKNQRYQGEYRLSYAYHCIRVESEEYSTCSHHIVLKRTSSR